MMKIKDTDLFRRKDSPTMEFRGIEIMADDGSSLFSIAQDEDGRIEIRAGMVVKHNGVLLADRIVIEPCVANAVVISRPKWPRE